MYLAILRHAISAMLLRNDRRLEKLVYYVCKALLDFESRYTSLNQLVLALLVATQKLRSYF